MALMASAQNWKVLDSVIRVFLSNDRLNWFIPMTRKVDQKRNLNPSWMARPVLFSSVIVPNAELLGVVFGFTNIT